MTKLEEMAKAAWKNHRNGNHVFGGPNQDDAWSDLTPQFKTALCDLMRAAIVVALREPNAAMVDACHQDDQPQENWRNMIDAILEEKP